jgi:hypothetical protein
VLRLSGVDADGDGKGGLNALRLVSKRCMQVVESVATRLTRKGDADSLPAAALKRSERIEHIRCIRLKSLEGCPNRLKSLKSYVHKLWGTVDVPEGCRISRSSSNGAGDPLTPPHSCPS